MKSLKEYENVETQPKGKHLRFQIAVMLFFLLIFISIFIIIRHQSFHHSSREVVQSSSSIHESIKKSEPVRKEKKTENISTSSKQKVVPSQTSEAPGTPPEVSNASTDNNTQTMYEAPQSANNGLVEQADTEQGLRQQAIDEANQKAEEIAQSLASSAQEEGYIVNIERQ